MSKRATKAAEAFLEAHGIGKIPVDVERLARKAGALLRRQEFEDGDVSGILLREDGRPPIIGVNASQAGVRQRFTIAHELGHLALHPGRLVILDRPMRVNARDSISATATSREEIEANTFAADILMPERLVRAHLQTLPERFRRDSDASTEWLANEFNVSIAAMGFRLMNLGVTT
ncbi:ImmA/IrrE family metallo-endopeptidase [Pseudonocardia cypriaca]|uniref:Uncharacterized protein DUF955 n=1 Tax=Pseudonocardia cypriaca TaxID=882449 RepID=A0A543FP52_9PSEU|nr:ImmA/IrrE family metallo-endopeptidase [Pseudonocardia cypriaca]TQM35627.1 uncharacterized protein DUF955 [Pseudonocardia cypriaca]